MSDKGDLNLEAFVLDVYLTSVNCDILLSQSLNLLSGKTWIWHFLKKTFGVNPHLSQTAVDPRTYIDTFWKLLMLMFRVHIIFYERPYSSEFE